MRAHGVPAVLGAAALALLPIAVLALAVLLLGGFVPHWSREIDAARGVVAPMLDRASLRFDLGEPAGWVHSVDSTRVRAFVRQELIDGAIVVGEASVLSFFALLSLGPAGRRLRCALPIRRCALLRSLAHEARRDLIGYFQVMVAVNAGLGVALALALAALGVPQPLLWGGVVFALLFVPYLGPLAAGGLLLIAGAARFGPTAAMAAPALVFVALHGVEANLISPWLTARRLQTNRVAVLVAVLAGAWAWGVIGGVLAVPLLIGARLALARAGTWPVSRALLAADEAVDAPATASRGR